MHHMPTSESPVQSSLAQTLVRHGMATLLVCLLITTVLTLSGDSRWDVNLVYSIAIGSVSWLSIEFGRMRFATSPEIPWPRGWRGIAVVIVGIALGFGVGTLIGQAYQQHQQPQPRLDPASRWLLPMLLTVIATAVMSLVFYLIGQSRHLQLKREQAERQAAQARLDLLQTQLEPHMLFNTLANLRALIDVDPPRAQTMLDHLIDYLRMTLASSQQPEHPLRDEFARLSDYLTLMQIRMGKRLAYTLDLPEAIAHVPVPPLLLQPLVENSIRHGIEPQVSGGSIKVRARHVTHPDGTAAIEIIVEDSGCGLSESPHATVQGETHMGTALVRDRLATRYGNAAQFSLSRSPDDTHTIARIYFPLEPSA